MNQSRWSSITTGWLPEWGKWKHTTENHRRNNLRKIHINEYHFQDWESPFQVYSIVDEKVIRWYPSLWNFQMVQTRWPDIFTIRMVLDNLYRHTGNLIILIEKYLLSRIFISRERKIWNEKTQGSKRKENETNASKSERHSQENNNVSDSEDNQASAG